MDPLNLLVVGFPTAVTILVLIGFYKVFVKKKSVSLLHTV